MALRRIGEDGGMAPLQLDSGDFIDVPRTTIAVIQNEAEALRTPNRDLRRLFAGGEERWHVDYFGERSFQAALANTHLYDGLVFGYNAIHESAELKAALREAPPPCHMVILHQYNLDCLEFLRGEVALRLCNLPSGDGGAHPPAECSQEDEVLLNWPHSVLPIGDGDCQALRSFSFEPGSAWRVMLDVERQRRRLPVLVRTATTAPARIVACSLLLDVQNEVHRRLLENVVMYCTLGRPRVAVLDSPAADGSYIPAQLAAKLRLQGAGTMIVRPGEDGVRVGDWPLRVAERVVRPAGSDDQPGPGSAPGDATHRNAERWKKAGGAIVEVHPDGSATARLEMEDTHAIARRWAAWFHGMPERKWSHRVFQLRAVLRMLDEIDADARKQFGLRAPARYREQARALLAPRVQDGSLEDTVGTTAAAYEIDALVGGCLPRRRGCSRAAVARWLRARVEDGDGAAGGTPPEERLDVARSLADPHLFARVLRLLARGEALGATAVIRLREAAVACREHADVWKPELLKIHSARLTGARIARELDGQLLASAEFVAAAAAFKRHLGDDRELAAYTQQALDDEPAWVAVATLARIGSLAQGQPQTTQSPQEVSTEALALHRYMGGERSATFQIWPQATEIPAKAVEALLLEVAAARAQRDRVERDRSALGLSVAVSTGIAIATIGALLWGDFDRHHGLHTPGRLAAFGWVAIPLLLFGGWFALGRWGDPDRRDIRLARHTVTALSLGSAAAAGVWLTSHVRVLGTLGTVAIFAILAVIALWGLSWARLGTGWAWAAVELLPGDTAAKLRDKLPRRRDDDELNAEVTRSANG